VETKRFEFILEAAQPIAHHAETFGNHAVIQRRRVRQVDGTFADVPVISADTMRHGMRESSAYAFLDAAGLLNEGNLTEAALRLLFAGGMVTGRGDGSTLNLDQYRQMCELCPPLALFGGCASNRVIPGRIFVEDAVLCCTETARFVPAWATETAGKLSSQRTHVEETQRVRMDPTLDPGKRKLLTSGEQVVANKRLESSEAAHESDDAIAREDAKSSMFPRTFERVVQGSLFSWAITAHTYSDLDIDTLMVALGVFLSRPVVGGKRGTGHGELRVVAARDITIQRPAEQATVVDVHALGGRVGSLFRAHVTERKERIKSFLGSVES
jgi:CRISPR type IV-associated protein Csf2